MKSSDRLSRYRQHHGHPIHDGDCSIYDAHMHICTCGLLHDLMAMGDEPNPYPHWNEDLMRERTSRIVLSMYFQGEIKVDIPPPPTDEECREMDEMIHKAITEGAELRRKVAKELEPMRRMTPEIMNMLLAAESTPTPPAPGAAKGETNG